MGYQTPEIKAVIAELKRIEKDSKKGEYRDAISLAIAICENSEYYVFKMNKGELIAN